MDKRHHDLYSSCISQNKIVFSTQICFHLTTTENLFLLAISMAYAKLQKRNTRCFLGLSFPAYLKGSNYTESTDTSTVNKVGLLCNARKSNIRFCNVIDLDQAVSHLWHPCVYSTNIFMASILMKFSLFLRLHELNALLDGQIGFTVLLLN